MYVQVQVCAGMQIANNQVASYYMYVQVIVISAKLMFAHPTTDTTCTQLGNKVSSACAGGQHTQHKHTEVLRWGWGREGNRTDANGFR